MCAALPGGALSRKPLSRCRTGFGPRSLVYRREGGGVCNSQCTRPPKGLRKPSGSGRLSPAPAGACGASLGKGHTRPPALRADSSCRRRTALPAQRRGVQRLSEEGRAAPGTATALTASRRERQLTPSPTLAVRLSSKGRVRQKVPDELPHLSPPTLCNLLASLMREGSGTHTGSGRDMGKRRALSLGVSFFGVVTTRRLSESGPKGGWRESRDGHFAEAFPRPLRHLFNTRITKHPWRGKKPRQLWEPL